MPPHDDLPFQVHPSRFPEVHTQGPSPILPDPPYEGPVQYRERARRECEQIRADRLCLLEVILVPAGLRRSGLYLVDIGVFGEDENGEEVTLYLAKHRVTSGQQQISVRVTEIPLTAGIDPRYKLVDRHNDDNVVEVEIRGDGG